MKGDTPNAEHNYLCPKEGRCSTNIKNLITKLKINLLSTKSFRYFRDNRKALILSKTLYSSGDFD